MVNNPLSKPTGRYPYGYLPVLFVCAFWMDRREEKRESPWRCFCAVLDACAMWAVLREIYVCSAPPVHFAPTPDCPSDLRIATVHIPSEQSPNRDFTLDKTQYIFIFCPCNCVMYIERIIYLCFAKSLMMFLR